MQIIGLGGRGGSYAVGAVFQRRCRTAGWRRCHKGSGEAGGGTSRRWQRPLSRSARVRSVGGVSGGAGEPRALCPGPHLSFYDAVRRGPPTMERLGTPDQDWDQGPN